MPTNFLYDLAMALVPGTAGGYYAGLLTTKYAKFNSLKYEALRIVRRIEYFGDSEAIRLAKAENLEEVQYISSELMTLRHRRAGKELFLISANILGVCERCRSGQFSAFEMNDLMSQWQSSIRRLRPGWNLFVPWGQL